MNEALHIKQTPCKCDRPARSHPLRNATSLFCIHVTDPPAAYHPHSPSAVPKASVPLAPYVAVPSTTTSLHASRRSQMVSILRGQVTQVATRERCCYAKKNGGRRWVGSKSLCHSGTGCLIKLLSLATHQS